VLAGEEAAAVIDEVLPMLVPITPIDVDLATELVEENLHRRSRAELDAVPGAVEALGRALAAAVDRHGDGAVRQDLALQFSPGELDVLLGARCRVRLVHGGADPVAGPAVGDWLAARLADATVEVWDGATHQGVLARWADFLA
jgi:pimeloyl-ACP methyl ester carboxylesterase